MNQNILLCGVGGQGTVLAAKIIASAAIARGAEVKTTETIGMAQRGGSVVSHVRIQRDTAPIHSPLIPHHTADIIIGFEPAEVVRNLVYLKEDGYVVVSQKAVIPVTSTLSKQDYNGMDMITYLRENVKNLLVVDGEALCEQCGSDKVLNMILLAAASSTGKLGIEQHEIRKALLKKIPEKLIKINEKALEVGGNV